ncbi:hypothetical protein SAMN05421780_11095 [Flexibacter flexilis DSM 6793]|uniref:CoA-binding domain-containing protein n=1 Tax=Flexibacter flexilis DSM 6793 TaxID=927664 RepID=A0A1I1MGG4_9BACT|nr:CoA-binding protein [Flexibacter flexilis]SFC82188.1 hypothetical protein SAMN05421780_11095 [Flexibacter flexilis DSM 6793]
MKTTLIIGASTSPDKYAYKAAQMLHSHGHALTLVGRDTGELLGEPIQNAIPTDTEIDTVTLYISPKRQPEYYDAIAALKPKRVIFNPGTENPDFEQKLEAQGIEAAEACTLVLLSTHQY